MELNIPSFLKLGVFINMKELIKRVLREESKSSVKDYLFKYWDKNGPSIEIGKYFSLSEFETAQYLFEYRNFNFDEVEEQVRTLIENYHECDGDEFTLRLDSIVFVPHKIVLVDGSGDVEEWYSYNVNFSIKNDSPVFNNEYHGSVDLNDYEDLETLYGQIEGCVENMLNNTIYFNYGITAYHCLFVGIYE